jgi:hypothetical protein
MSLTVVIKSCGPPPLFKKGTPKVLYHHPFKNYFGAGAGSTREEQERQSQRRYEEQEERNRRRREAEQARETEVALWRGELRCNWKLPAFDSRVCPDAEDSTCCT